MVWRVLLLKCSYVLQSWYFLGESSIFLCDIHTVHIALLPFVIVDADILFIYMRIQDGRDLLFACARSGNMQLVRWFAEEYDPELTLMQV